MTRPTPTMAGEPLNKKKVYRYVDSDMLPYTMLSFNASRVDVNFSKRSATSTEVIFWLCNATLIQSLAVKIFVPAQPI
jgi:hypothetical protein